MLNPQIQRGVNGGRGIRELTAYTCLLEPPVHCSIAGKRPSYLPGWHGREGGREARVGRGGGGRGRVGAGGRRGGRVAGGAVAESGRLGMRRRGRGAAGERRRGGGVGFWEREREQREHGKEEEARKRNGKSGEGWRLWHSHSASGGKSIGRSRLFFVPKKNAEMNFKVPNGGGDRLPVP